MQLRFQELFGSRVVSADGVEMGRVVDLRAERRGDELRVVALHVGAMGLTRRIGFRRLGRRAVVAREIPWAWVAGREGDRLQLRLDAAEATAQVAKRRREDAAAEGAKT